MRTWFVLAATGLIAALASPGHHAALSGPAPESGREIALAEPGRALPASSVTDAVAVATPAAFEAATPPRLLAPVDVRRVPTELPRSEANVARERLARLDPALFARGGAWTWNLFDDVELPVVLDRRDTPSPARGGSVWRGHVDGDPHSLVVVFASGGRVTASVALSDGQTFAIDTIAPGVQRVQEIDVSALAGCGSDREVAVDSPQASSGPDPGIPPAIGMAEGETIDLLLIYTEAAKDLFGSKQAIEDRLELLVQWANAVYENSDADQRVRAVSVREVDYDDSHGNGIRALEDLSFDDDGELETGTSDVFALRDLKGADMVVLFTAPLDVCGIAWVATYASLIEWYEDWMFSVVSADCTGSPRTFTHELGHNQGAYHDPETSILQGRTQQEIDDTPWPNSYGFIAPADAFHTVMAYGSSCGWCPSLQQFSNPALDVGGVPSGNATSDVHTTLNETWQTIAAFRDRNAGCALDADLDGICDDEDNCLGLANANQLDSDLDGYGDACDADYGGDGWVGLDDFALVAQTFGLGVGDAGFDPRPDHDGDGWIGLGDLGFTSASFGSSAGPSGLACAGATPCPAP